MYSASPNTSLGENKQSFLEAMKSATKTITNKQSDRYEEEKLPPPGIDQQTQTLLGLAVKPKVQEDFRNLLLEFVLNCLLDQPGDVVHYAAGYFTDLEDRKHTKMIQDYPAAKEETEIPDFSSTSEIIDQVEEKPLVNLEEKNLPNTEISVENTTGNQLMDYNDLSNLDIPEESGRSVSTDQNG